MPSQSIDLPQGTLDLLILRTLSLEPLHGWAVSERIQQISSDVLRVQQGSLYPALHRLERRGWIKARWGTSENNRKAKFYELTKAGRQPARNRTRGLGEADGCREPDPGNGLGRWRLAARLTLPAANVIPASRPPRAELDDELRFHLERQIAKYVKSGMSEEEATRRARVEFGGIDQVKDECREAPRHQLY